MENLFADILSKDRILTDFNSLQTYGRDWLKDYLPAPRAILLPGTIGEVSAILARCSEEQIAVVPSGGRTGLSGGATALRGEVVLSLERMNRLIGVSGVDRTITVQAGVTTERVQIAAQENGLYFPVDFASKGSSQIGGNLATNAGGIRVIRYGNMRDWVVGMTVVLASGEVLVLNGHLFKNQTGYDLRSLLIGSEGTLGVIVEATLRLASLPRGLTRMVCGLKSLDAALPLLQRARDRFGVVSAFECFAGSALGKVLSHHKLRDPFSARYPWNVLIEIEEDGSALETRLEAELGACLEDGLIEDVVVSQGPTQAAEFLSLRELISETLSTLHTLHKNDVSVPVSDIPAFVSRLEAAIESEYSGFEVVVFGHVGDGNLHVNVLMPEGMEKSEFFERCRVVDRTMFGLVQSFSGSISAEHGVGLLKKEFLPFSRTPTEVALMKAIKQVFDPGCILNPGKIFDIETAPL